RHARRGQVKRLDALVLKELLGPWVFGVSMFTMLLLSATYLGRIANYVVQGVSGSLILKVTLLLLPAILVQTFAMALLLGTLLAFGRLSGDSEITAIRAAGVSLYRIVAPVAVFSLIVAAGAFYMNEQVVPPATRESAALMANIAKGTTLHSAQPIKHIEVKNGKVVLMIGALDFSLLHRDLRGVQVTFYDKNENVQYYMTADGLEFTSLQEWRISGKAELLSADGSNLIKVTGAWPEGLPTLTSSPEDILAGQNTVMDTYSMSQIREQIAKGRASGNFTIEMIRNYEYFYWNKIALPLAAFIFGTLGATLGIRNQRTGTATGFAIAIIIIFGYFMLSSFMNVFAQGGIFPPYIASFTPIAIGLVASGVIIWRRNR
ncbi:MAG: LptF/LptG family permease, partial [Fimbriimonadales bacterium]